MDTLTWVVRVLIFAFIVTTSIYTFKYIHLKDLIAQAKEEEEELHRKEPFTFTKRPVKIKALRVLDIDEEFGIAITSRTYGDLDWPKWFLDSFNKGDIQVGKKDNDNVLYVKTLEGEHVIRVGMWVICGVKGEIYGCQHEIFEETYE